MEHAWLNRHAAPTATPYRWEFTEDGRDVAVAVPARVLSTDSEFDPRLVRSGVGVPMALEHRVRDEIARVELVEVLEAYSTPFPGVSLYYPQRRQASPALRALAGYMRAALQLAVG